MNQFLLTENNKIIFCQFKFLWPMRVAPSTTIALSNGGWGLFGCKELNRGSKSTFIPLFFNYFLCFNEKNMGLRPQKQFPFNQEISSPFPRMGTGCNLSFLGGGFLGGGLGRV